MNKKKSINSLFGLFDITAANNQAYLTLLKVQKHFLILFIHKFAKKET